MRSPRFCFLMPLALLKHVYIPLQLTSIWKVLFRDSLNKYLLALKKLAIRKCDYPISGRDKVQPRGNCTALMLPPRGPTGPAFRDATTLSLPGTKIE